ncbi:MAG: hypothetical protein FWC43_10390 [Planctomycetaceae bacterium]|nr:hypothetical protein [Planctomycetaceae bacterium]
MSDDEFRLAPLDDEDELKLAPLDEKETRKIAPDFPLETDLRLMPVVCSACKTRMYATEDQVGMWKVCPDCHRQTEIFYVEPEFRFTVELDENGGYLVKKPEIEHAPTFNIGVDYRTVDGYQKPEFIKQRVFDDEQPKMEAFLQGLLESKIEKERKQKKMDLEKKIEEEMRLAKRKRMETVGDNTNSSARKTNEKNNLPSKHLPTPPLLPAPPRPKQPEPSLPPSSADSRLPPTPFWPGLRNFLEPFLSPINRKKLIVLFIIGYLANYFGEQIKSAFAHVFLETHPEGTAYVMSYAEMGFFSVNFFVGIFFGIVWLILVLLFGINILTTTASGKIKVERWIMFDLGLGFSYIFWTSLMLFVSFYPGVFLIWGIEAVFPEFATATYVYPWIAIFFLSPIFTFPISFLCVTETDTFFGGWPKKTLGSLALFPMLWLKFFGAVLLFSVVPILFLGTLAYLNLFHYENPWMQSIGYYIVSAFLETVLLGFFPLIYFRFLGRVSWVISQDFPEDEE